MTITSAGLVLIAAGGIAVIGASEFRGIEQKLRSFSQNEMASMHALVLGVMERRVSDSNNVAIDVFNKWFEQRNKDYPGQLWSVWSPQVTAYMKRIAPSRTLKTPRDATDEEALRTGKAVSGFVDGAYRYSFPIVLGVTAGAEQAICHACHGGAMGIKDGQTIAVFSSNLPAAAEFARLRTDLMVIAAGGLVAVAALVLASRMVFVRVISRRLSRMNDAMLRLAEGDRTVVIPPHEHADEIGDMASALDVFKANAEQAARLTAEKERAQAVREQRRAVIEQETAAFGVSVSRIMQALTTSADVMRRAAETMDKAASGVQLRASETASNAATVSDNLDAVSASVTAITSSFGDISAQLDTTATMAHQASSQADANQRTMQGLADAVTQIGAVVQIIGDVATRTNLLALNATIEAARAGEAGRGFAVVAGEVKALATQTSSATKQIENEIAMVRQAASAATGAMRAVSESIGRIDNAAGAIAGTLSQQATATEGVARNVQAVTAATDSTAQAMEAVASDAVEANTVSQEVLSVAAEVRGLADELNAEVARFLATVSEEAHPADMRQAA
ncbi:MAG: methyl-accepting chemotaxis protein [Rhodopila sp.]